MAFFDKKLIRFIFVGILNTAIGAGVMFFLYNVLHCSYWLSSAANYIVGGIVSYFLNKHFTFKNKEKGIGQVLLFALNLAVCYVLAYILAKNAVLRLLPAFSKKAQDNIAMLCGMVVYTLLNYLSQRFIIFNMSEPLNSVENVIPPPYCITN